MTEAEAALDAVTARALEAMQAHFADTPHLVRIGYLGPLVPGEKRPYVSLAHPIAGRSEIAAFGDSFAHAYAKALAEREHVAAQPVKLETAAEAAEAIKALVGDNPELVAKIDALPVKR